MCYTNLIQTLRFNPQKAACSHWDLNFAPPGLSAVIIRFPFEHNTHTNDCWVPVMLYLLPFCLLNHYWHPTSVTQTSQCFHGPQCISPHFHSGTNLMADVVAGNAQTLILNWKNFFHCCCFPIFNEPCAPAYIWSLLKKEGKWWVTTSERDGWWEKTTERRAETTGPVRQCVCVSYSLRPRD